MLGSVPFGQHFARTSMSRVVALVVDRKNKLELVL